MSKIAQCQFERGCAVRRAGLFLLLAWSAAWPCAAATWPEDFSVDPASRGWRRFGDPTLFSWNAADLRLEVTWDSSRVNSYFYCPLDLALNKHDDFSLRFDLRLDSIQGGVNPDKPSTFEIAVGFFHLASATNAGFNRGTGRASPNLVEWDYFPPADIIAATVSPTMVSSNNQFQPSFNFPLEMDTGVLFQVMLRFTASNQTLVTTMARNGVAFGPIRDVRLATHFTDFRVDAVSINSYNDGGDPFGSVLARGTVDNLEVTLPDPPVFGLTGQFSNDVWQVQFASCSNWLYTLERSSNFHDWISVPPAQAGTGGALTLADPHPDSGTARFYRVRAEKP
jgi:hypothetical protein